MHNFLFAEVVVPHRFDECPGKNLPHWICLINFLHRGPHHGIKGLTVGLLLHHVLEEVAYDLLIGPDWPSLDVGLPNAQELWNMTDHPRVVPQQVQIRQVSGPVKANLIINPLNPFMP